MKSSHCEAAYEEAVSSCIINDTDLASAAITNLKRYISEISDMVDRLNVCATGRITPDSSRLANLIMEQISLRNSQARFMTSVIDNSLRTPITYLGQSRKMDEVYTMDWDRLTSKVQGTISFINAQVKKLDEPRSTTITIQSKYDSPEGC